MRIMWIAAAPMGVMASKFGMKVLGSGGWIDSCLKSITNLKENDFELHYFALGNRNDFHKDEGDCVSYYLTDVKKRRGKRADETSVRRWKEYISDINPDIIQVWGTEYSLGLEVEKAAGNIPVLFFIQGVMKCIDEHGYGDLPTSKYFKYCGLETIPKLVKYFSDRRAISQQAEYEAEMIKQCFGIIVDTEWAKAQYSRFTNNSFEIPLPINSVFYKTNWSLDKCERYSAFTVAGRTPLKGLHIIIQAWEEIVKKYPEAKLYIPGNISCRSPKLFYEPLYIKYLRRLIEAKKLDNNIIFCGGLSQDDMALHMSKCNVFIMPSCIENHSSTLREAMAIGAPCISSYVGSVCEFIINGKNGFMYRYNEKDTLTYYVRKIFESNGLANNLSSNAKSTIRNRFPQECIGNKYIQLYRKILDEIKSRG